MKKRKKRKNKIPVIREEETVETNNRMRDDSDIVRWSHIGYFLKNAILWYLGLNIFMYIVSDNPELFMSKGLYQFGMLVWAGLMGMIFQVEKFK